jgi:putative Holliday junction resolvase
MRRGVRIGVDVGTVRIGLARSDPDGLLATPLETVQRGQDVAQAVARIAALADELEAIELVVGLPLSMRGTDTASTADARRVAALLAAGPRPVRMLDERLTTVSAQSALRASGRNTRGSRPVIDQVAAVILLQHALDAERARGEAPGALLDPNRK